MAGSNAQIQAAFKEYKEAMMNELEQNCLRYCDALCDEAIYQRFHNGGHNFTGNLINSIVVGLYRERRPVYVVLASSKLGKSPIHVKMTKGKKYHFKPDWDGFESHVVNPSIRTDEGYGNIDAVNFYAHYKPKGKNLFDIVVAYPVEYADFVEQDHQSTGILNTYAYADNVGVTFLHLPRA